MIGETEHHLRLKSMFKTYQSLQLQERLKRRRKTRELATEAMWRNSMLSMSKRWANSWILLTRMVKMKNLLSRIKKMEYKGHSKMTRIEKMTLMKRRMIQRTKIIALR